MTIASYLFNEPNYGTAFDAALQVANTEYSDQGVNHLLICKFHDGSVLEFNQQDSSRTLTRPAWQGGNLFHLSNGKMCKAKDWENWCRGVKKGCKYIKK